MNDRTSDLTDEHLYATMAEHWSDPGKFIPGQEYWRRYAAALRAVAALARQGWAPVGTGPSIKDAPDHVSGSSSSLSKELWDLINESDGVYGLHKNGDFAPWDELLPGGEYERLSSLRPFDDAAPDHIADVSNMVESAADTVYSEHLNPTQCNQ